MYCTNIQKNVCLYLFQVHASYFFERHSDNMCKRMMPMWTKFLFVGYKNWSSVGYKPKLACIHSDAPVKDGKL